MQRLLPLLVQETDILSHVRQVVENATNGDPLGFPSAFVLEELRDWGTSVESRSVILQVCKGRLSLEWPYNYKAITVLSLMPHESLYDLIDTLAPLAESDNSWVRPYALPLLAAVKEAAPKEDEKQEDEIVWNVPQDIPWGLWAVVWVEPKRWWLT